jgi:Tol biopolymer transport system component
MYFSSDRGGAMNLWRIGIDERSGRPLGQPEPVTTGVTAEALHLSLSADGLRVAYSSRVTTSNIMTVDLDPATRAPRGQPRVVTTGSQMTTMSDVSPDGEWIAFVRSKPFLDVFVSRADGSGMRQLTNDRFIDRSPRWSPDGNAVAFFSNRGGKYEIWAINADGSGLRQLTRTQATTINPVWSPDSTHLAFTDNRTTSFIADLTVPLEQRTPRALPLLPSPGEAFLATSWSRDGKWIAGVRLRAATHVRAGVAVYALESRRYELLTDYGEFPAWLGDDRTIVFNSGGDYGSRIDLVDRQTKKTRTLVADPARALTIPAASSDGRAVYFTSAGAESDVWLMTIPGR